MTAKLDRLAFVVNARMQEPTTHAPRTVATHEKPTDWPDKWLLASRVLNLTIFTIIILQCKITSISQAVKFSLKNDYSHYLYPVGNFDP